MLSRKHARGAAGAFAGAVIAVLAVFGQAGTASAASGAPVPTDPGCGTAIICDTGTGHTGGTPGSGDSGDEGSGDSGGTAPAKFTPGPTTCTWTNSTSNIIANEWKPGYEPPHDVSCTYEGGWWETGGDCPEGYVKLADPQKDPPAGQSASVGAWYQCTPWCPINDVLVIGEGVPQGCEQHDFWSNTPPPGINTYTPAQAAAALIETIKLGPVSIGMAPESKVHADDPAGTAAYRRTWVGIPVWLWVNPGSDFGDLNFGGTFGGITVTATASADSVQWSSGDGQTVVCGKGTVFDEAAMANQPAQDSPTCGFRYEHTSADQPDGTYTVTATTVWTITWTAGDQTGTVDKGSVSSHTQVRVGQLESVNVPVTQAQIDGR